MDVEANCAAQNRPMIQFASLTGRIITFPNFGYALFPFWRCIKHLAFWTDSALPIGVFGSRFLEPMFSILEIGNVPITNATQSLRVSDLLSVVLSAKRTSIFGESARIMAAWSCRYPVVNDPFPNALGVSINFPCNIICAFAE